MRLKASQAADIRLGRQRAPEFESGDHQTRYLRSANVTADGRIDVSDIKRMNFTPAEQSIYGLRPGDVLVTEGSGSRDTVGASAVWQSHLSGTVCFQNTLLRLRPRLGVTDGRYLAWWACHAHAAGQMAQVASGANILHLGSDGLKNLHLVVPPVPEQRRIADFLDDHVSRIDSIITARREQTTAIEAHRQAQLITTIVRDDDDLVPCGSVTEVRLGRQRSPRHEVGDHMTRYLRSANVTDGRIDLRDVKEMNFGPKEQQTFGLRPGDVLVSEGSASSEALGAAAVWSGGLAGVVCFQNTLLRLRPRDERLDAAYLGYWARASHAAGAPRSWASGASILHLGAEGMSRMPIPNITVQEQQRRTLAAGAAEQANTRLLEALEQQVSLLAEYKQSLITAAVKGEFDVTAASGRGIPA